MTQVVSNKTGREKIIKAQGDNTEIFIEAKKDGDIVQIVAKLNLSKSHNFKPDYKIFLQAYESKGYAKEPKEMGQVSEPWELKFNILDIPIDSLLFRIKIIDKNNVVRGFADEIRADLQGESKGTKSGETSEQSNTILPIKEDSNLILPFAVQMEPDQKPVLLVKSKLNLKEQFKHDIITKVLIYTSIIRQILHTYLSDKNFQDCEYKDKFIGKVLSNAGSETEIKEIPNYFDDDGCVNQDALEWIEEQTAACINTPVEFRGRKENYLSLFEAQCKAEIIEDDYEN
jgi:hypothetical protein